MNKERYFRHFKGGIYKFIGKATDSETQEELVVYQAMYGDKKIWVRPIDMFYEIMTIDGKQVNRFRELTYEETLKYVGDERIWYDADYVPPVGEALLVINDDGNAVRHTYYDSFNNWEKTAKELGIISWAKVKSLVPISLPEGECYKLFKDKMSFLLR
jgi:hypothetical protein|nr:MAG: Protein of unknown function (DUF1653) [Bacteriophage sp.]UWG24377.1 MAG: Protein of unknown function (DUF1653) [Bacteriophage sp.]